MRACVCTCLCRPSERICFHWQINWLYFLGLSLPLRYTHCFPFAFSSLSIFHIYLFIYWSQFHLWTLTITFRLWFVLISLVAKFIDFKFQCIQENTVDTHSTTTTTKKYPQPFMSAYTLTHVYSQCFNSATFFFPQSNERKEKKKIVRKKSVIYDFGVFFVHFFPLVNHKIASQKCKNQKKRHKFTLYFSHFLSVFLVEDWCCIYNSVYAYIFSLILLLLLLMVRVCFFFLLLLPTCFLDV